MPSRKATWSDNDLQCYAHILCLQALTSLQTLCAYGGGVLPGSVLDLVRKQGQTAQEFSKNCESGDVEVSKEKLLVLRNIATNLKWAQEDKPQDLSEQMKVVKDLMQHEGAILEAHGVLDAAKERSDGEVTVLQTV
ncbi:MAG: hypothetical protein LQ337_007141 [Flavoplaca oasis]|nr:MAG: hypothetical protein LQ337_007141 [Flavoplaca oasis]